MTTVNETADASVRRQWMRKWTERTLGGGWEWKPLAGDASFRIYWRLRKGHESLVLMDAPPPHEDVQPFLYVRAWLARAGLRVPSLYAADTKRGFVLLEDFGDLTWAEHLRRGRDPEPLVADALEQLQCLQASAARIDLPLFDSGRMQRECELYLQWYLPYVADCEPSPSECHAFREWLQPILQALEALPRVPVHLDFHSRNLMLPDGKLPLGIIDFQDAVIGPVTYDPASLLYDCYQDYPEPQRRRWSRRFFSSLPAFARSAFAEFEEWHRLLRLTAMQRHIKAIGIFARLAFRDGKHRFLEEIPLTRKHLTEALEVLNLQEPTGLLHRSPRP